LSERAYEFAIASRDELWLFGACVESRLSHGRARHHGNRIDADDAFDAELVAACEEDLAGLRREVVTDARVRLVASARRVRGVVLREATMTITIAGVSVVTRNAPVLRELLALPPAAEAFDPRRPLVWRNGSAAVLLHEAVGHAAEHEAAPVAWPAWLSVRDEPGFAVDDCGEPVRAADLLREPPSSMRRESFRDVPLRRMSALGARQDGAPFDVPSGAIDVHLVAGGSYDPLTDRVTINVAVSSAGPFTLSRSRAEVAASITGATGEPLAYPGVICSREGQEIAVASAAPLMVTR
jgi:hypothetical protein